MSKPEETSHAVRVRGQAGKGRWPLKGITEGTIFCHWHEFAPGNGSPLTRRPLILFKASDGQLYAINGAAESAAAKGFITAASISDIMVDGRLRSEVGKVLDHWLDAGLALCKGDFAAAQRLAAEADRIALEPMPPGIEFDLSSAEDEVRRRRIFFELVACQDKAWRKAGDDFDKMKALEEACYPFLQEKENLTEAELIAIAEEGRLRLWPMPDF